LHLFFNFEYGYSEKVSSRVRLCGSKGRGQWPTWRVALFT
jgi:hypothetical protein